MLVKAKIEMNFANKKMQPGEMVELPGELAQALIAGGYAELAQVVDVIPQKVEEPTPAPETLDDAPAPNESDEPKPARAKKR